MNRVQELKEKVSELNQLLDSGYPRYRFDKETSEEISQKITLLKELASQLSNQLRKQYSNGELSRFEMAFIEPAISEAYMKGIAKIRRGAKPNQTVHGHIVETLFTLEHWIGGIEEYKSKDL
ncbi:MULTISPECIES: hypothetical protein [Morganellaceae]|uniref:hypothetical protein n=1 Tax=Morganellaceae TaxID=1903414 RepID=UPI000327537E|nr:MULTISPECIES: hypothetical protein [Morganellaceae]RAW69300.1 hypothetical protein CKY14_17465 [Photorhabdus sp. S14-60]RAW70341.1 hypothetical protein CKY15_11735 [Photorhabdus sp. S7-51]RAW77442.1 hypothetical protein CKY06_12230 [Photorhabdus sp. S15-56]CCW29658.1 hypothetical protein XNC3_1530054 [Xenorhabdus nematophila F1]